MEHLIEYIKSLGLPPELQIILIASLPVLELRGAIPYGILALKMTPFKTLILSLLGNLIIIIPLLFLVDALLPRLEKIEIGKKILERAKSKGKVVEKFELLGLFIFVAIPLPGTGAWTGVLLAIIFGMKKHLAIPAISLGVIVAGLIVTFIVNIGTWKGILLGVLFLIGVSKMLDYIIEKK